MVHYCLRESTLNNLIHHQEFLLKDREQPNMLFIQTTYNDFHKTLFTTDVNEGNQDVHQQYDE